MFTGLPGYPFDLLDGVAFFLAASLVTWVWWGVPKWQVALAFAGIGLVLCAATLAAFFGMNLATEAAGWGPMQHFLLVIPLAPRLGILAGGLLCLLLGKFHKDAR
jgi:hypothetical protein